MNKIFKVVWSKVRNAYVVVSEVAKVNGKCSVKSRVGRASLAAVMAVTVMMSGTAMAADDVDFTGTSYVINDADGANNVTLTTTTTDTYGVTANSGEITVGDLTINADGGGIKILAESTPTTVTLNAGDINITNSKWSAFYTTSLNSTTEALEGSSLTVNANDIITSGECFAGAGDGKRVEVNANTIETTTTNVAVWGWGDIELNAQDITIDSSGFAAINTRSDGTDTPNFDLNATNALEITGAVNSGKGTVSLEGQESVTVNGRLATTATDAAIDVNGKVIDIVGDVSSSAGTISLVGQESVTTEGMVGATSVDANIDIDAKNVHIIGEDHNVEGHRAAVFNNGTVEITGTESTTVEGCLVSKNTAAVMDIEGNDIAVNGEAYSYAGAITLTAQNDVTISDAVTAASADANINITGTDISITGEDPTVEGHKAAVYSSGNVEVTATNSATIDGCVVTEENGVATITGGENVSVQGKISASSSSTINIDAKQTTVSHENIPILTEDVYYDYSTVSAEDQVYLINADASTVNIEGGLTAKAKGLSAYGVEAVNGSTVTIGSADEDIVIDVESINAIYHNEEYDVNETVENEAQGITAESGSTVDIVADKLEVSVYDGNGDSGSIQARENSQITVTANQAVLDRTVFAGDEGTVIDLSGVKILDVNSMIQTEDGGRVILGRTGDRALVNVSGGIYADNNGQVDVTLDTSDSMLVGSVMMQYPEWSSAYTGVEGTVNVTLNNGATWDTGYDSWKNEVSSIAGDHGVLAIDMNDGDTAVTINSNTNENLVVKGARLDTNLAGTRVALIGLDEKLKKAVTIESGNEATYVTAAINTNLVGEVELRDDRVITTMDTDDLVIKGDVSVGGVSMTNTVQQVTVNTNAISQVQEQIEQINVSTNAETVTKNTTDIAANKADIETNAQNIATNTEAISGLQAQVDTNIANITTNKEAISGLQTQVDTNIADITTNTEAISGLQTKVDTNISAIEQVQNEISQIKANTNAETVAQNTANIAANTTAIETNAQNIAANTADITSNTSAIGTLQTTVNTNTSSIAQAQNDIVANAAAIAANKTDVVTNTANIKTNTDSIVVNRQAIAANADAISGLQTKVDTNTNAIATNAGNISNLQTKVDTNTSNIAQVQSSIQTNSTAISGLQTKVDANTSAIQNVQAQIEQINVSTSAEAVAQNTADIVANSQAIVQAQAAIETNAESISGVQTQADTNAAAIAANTTSIAKTQKNVKTNTNSISQLKKEVASIKDNTNASTVAKNTKNIKTNAANIKTNATNIKSNSSKIATAQKNIKTNAANIKSNSSKIATAQKNIKTNAANIKSNSSKIATAQKNIKTNAANIKSNSSKIATAQKNIKTNAANIKSNSSKITTAQKNIKTNAANIKSNSSKIATAQKNIKTNAANIKTNTNSIAKLKKEVASIKDNTNAKTVAANTKNIKTNAANIKSNASKIKTNTANITQLQNKVADMYTRAEADATFVKIESLGDSGIMTASLGDNFVVEGTAAGTEVLINQGTEGQVAIGADGKMIFGTNSTAVDEHGLYAGRIDETGDHDYANAKAALNDEGEIKGASGKFTVDKAGNVQATSYNGVDVGRLNQQVSSLEGRVDKVGAGAAALAALHPLEYDPDDKLTFSAGVGSYAGATAAAVGAFYRPNEDVMLSIGGTAGNGENMVNMGVSFALGKGGKFTKLSKQELIRKVQEMEEKYQTVEAENKEAQAKLEAENREMKEKLEALEKVVAELAAKK